MHYIESVLWRKFLHYIICVQHQIVHWSISIYRRIAHALDARSSFPGYKLFFSHIDGHSSWVNTAALNAITGVTKLWSWRWTNNPYAMDYVSSLIPEWTDIERFEMFCQWADRCHHRRLSYLKLWLMIQMRWWMVHLGGDGLHWLSHVVINNFGLLDQDQDHRLRIEHGQIVNACDIWYS